MVQSRVKRYTIFPYAYCWEYLVFLLLLKLGGYIIYSLFTLFYTNPEGVKLGYIISLHSIVCFNQEFSIVGYELL